MERKRGAPGRNRNVFKGSVLVSLLVESHPKRFPSRAAACKLARRLFRQGQIRSIFGAKEFEDSAQLYVWHDDDVTQDGHGRNMTSPTSSSCSNPASLPRHENSGHKQADWRLIQDIKTKVLNRSEAYNIVTSYNTFFQELEQDFGFDHSTHSPRKSHSGGSEIGWSGSSNNTPYTSTLEFKKDSVYSTDSSVDNHYFSGKSRNDKRSKKHSKRSSLSPYSKSSSSKDTSPHISQDTPPHLNHHYHLIEEDHNSQQHHHQNRRHQHQQQQHFQGSANMNSNKDSVGNANVHSSHGHMTEDRLSEGIRHPTESAPPSHLDPTIIEYEATPNQHGTAGSQISSMATESVDNNTPTNTGSTNTVVNARNQRWPPEVTFPHPQSSPRESKKWSDPRAVNGNVNPGYGSDHLGRERDDHGHGTVDAASRSRWTESEGMDSGRRWPESANSYSDNEKQLLEEMRRMKKEHQNVLRTYEGRINKLMAKMHELRNIAEMLENSSSKSSPYGVLPGKLALLNILEGKDLDEKKLTPVSGGSDTDQVPPPLPPRPGRGSRVYPNKPIIKASVAMRPLPWSRIILEDSGPENASTVWQAMTEPKIDTGELERLFSGAPEYLSDVNLYDDICLRRGRSKSQIVSFYDPERSQRIVSELRALRCTLPEVIQAFVTLNSDNLHTDSFAELLELLTSQRELDKIFHHVKRKGGGQLDAPEYLVFELSKVDHFRERLEFLRFKNKLQINLFEIDQQLRELQTACEEITTSLSLKHVLETVLAVGNHMNAGTERGQADGFRVDILNTLKDFQEPAKQGNLLELIMKTYCLKYEADIELGCPTRFRLPEPSNMRHAAQVSFEDIQRALKELKEELALVRQKLESLSKREGSTLTIALRVTSENFMTSAVEVLAEEQKLFDDTKSHFWRTTAYFSIDGQKSSPHDFFQIWATFLHDCKYYWKLAHRNLAKSKFSTDLATKSQLSCSSLPGFNSLKSVMMKHVASFQKDEEMRVSKAQQLQHINSWIESVGRYALEMLPEGLAPNLEAEDNVDHHHHHSRPSQMSQPYHGQQQQQQQQQQHPLLQQAEQLHDQASSPPYKNQPAIASHVNKEGTHPDSREEKHHNREAKSGHRASHSKGSKHHDAERRQRTPSPKPINSTPPNVIKPQPIVHKSPTLSSPSPTAPSLQFSQPLSLTPYQPESSLDTNNNKESKSNSDFQDDNFGFEPLYESLSRHTQNQPNGQHVGDSENQLLYHDDAGHTIGPNGSLSPDSDSAQKKNAKFFKSLLKRDQKRSVSQDESPQGNQHSALKSVSAPFNKLRNTFVQKLSGNTSSKKSSSDPSRVSDTSNQYPPPEIPAKPKQGFPTERNAISPVESPRDDGKSRINYQNYYYPGQPRRPEASNMVPKMDHQDGPSSYAVKPMYRDGHDSVPSTISSLQSYRDQGPAKYHGSTDHLSSGLRDPHQDPTEVKQSPKNFHTENDNDGSGSAKRSSRARVRAPIALGSNMSISDIYGKAAEYAQNQDSSNIQNQPAPHYGTDEMNPEDIGTNNITSRPSPSDPKWVKASAVPVYKAKLIPNYENQSKYDPRLEGGVRGQAEAAVPAKHTPQISISSEVYRQELQKKSEQYVGGGIYPSPAPSNGNLRSSGTLTGPTSYTVLPPKPTHYHASPIIVTQNGVGINATGEKASNSNLGMLSGNLESDTPPNRNQGHSYQSQENSAPSSSGHSPQQYKPNFTVSPDGRLELDQGQSGQSAESRRERRQERSPHTRRSSSAHNILERDHKSSRSERSSHSAHASPGNQQMKSQSRVSRKDVGGKKTTPTSHRERSEGRLGNPQSVTSLIDKFEMKPEGNHLNIGLLDIDDKPPSMTSTPVARRKNQTVSSPPNSSGRSSGQKSEGEGSRSHSEASKKSSRRQEMSGGSGQPNNKTVSASQENIANHLSPHQYSSKSPHQAVSPFYVQQSHGAGDQHQNIHTSQYSRDGQDQHGGRHHTNIHHASPHHTNQHHNVADQHIKGSHHPSQDDNQPMNFPNSNQFQQQLQHPDRFGSLENQHSNIRQVFSERVPSQMSGERSQLHTPSDRGLRRTPSDNVRSDHSRSSSSKRSPHSQSQSKTSYMTPPASSSSSLQSGNYQSAFLPKPEAHYPNPSSMTDLSPNQQSQHHNYPYHHHRQQHLLQPQQRFSGSSSNSHAAVVQPQPQHPHQVVTPNYTSQPQTSQRRPSPQVSHNSHPAHQPSSYTSPSSNNATGESGLRNSDRDHGKYFDNLQQTPKSTNSAFERPLKAGGPYNRQPGAMAVVKPTVMNL